LSLLLPLPLLLLLLLLPLLLPPPLELPLLLLLLLLTPPLPFLVVEPRRLGAALRGRPAAPPWRFGAAPRDGDRLLAPPPLDLLPPLPLAGWAVGFTGT
jgi:hypothetical protein